MGDRTIVTHCGGELVLGGGPPIDNVMHGWIYEESGRRRRAPYGFMLGHREARHLSRALQMRQAVEIRTFNGRVRVTHTTGLAHLWFYSWEEEDQPDRVCRLYEGAREAAAEAIGEVCDDSEPPKCSFCLKGKRKRVVDAPGGLQICDECLDLANHPVAA